MLTSGVYMSLANKPHTSQSGRSSKPNAPYFGPHDGSEASGSNGLILTLLQKICLVGNEQLSAVHSEMDTRVFVAYARNL